MSPFRRVIIELKRRRVYRVAVAYAAVAFVVWQAAEIAVPSLNLPEWVLTLVIVLTVLGFPIAVVLAWAFDITPAGVRRTEPSLATLDLAGPKSIVVLPFDNISPDEQDRYLGDGLTEELTAKLSKLGHLRVISRTSAMQLKHSDKDLSTIARDLDVQYVLEGSVRRAGDTLRITAQLIDALKDQHLWSESYSGTVEDVFGMQEKVSLAIVHALRLELSPEETRRLEERSFHSFQAYQFYIQARADYLLASEESLDRALHNLDIGLSTLGENELLYVARGMVLFQLVNGMLKSASLHGEFIDEAHRCADRALVLNADSAPARALKGFVLHARGDVPGAATQMAESLALDPNNPEALLILGYYRACGGWDRDGAREILLQLERTDPLTPLNAGALGWLHWFDGDFGAALERFQPWWDAMDHGNPWLLVRAYLLAAEGDEDTATRTVEAMHAQAPQHLLTQLGRFLVHAWRSERDEALAAVTEDLKTAARWDDIWPYFLAVGYAALGERDEAFYWLDHAVDHGVTNVAYLREGDPFTANLRDDPRFEASLAKAARLAQQVETAVSSLIRDG